MLNPEAGRRFYLREVVGRAARREVNAAALPQPARREDARYASAGVLANTPHSLELKDDAGKLHDWYARKLLPLYHAGRLGRISRPEAKQRADMRALREHLGRST